MMILDELNMIYSRGDMNSLCIGPLSLFIRCKVKHPVVRKIIGETVAEFLNCIVIDVSDKNSTAVQQCLVRSMITCSQGPRWIFKDFDEGWHLENLDLVNVGCEVNSEEVEDTHSLCDDIEEPSGLYTFMVSVVSSILNGIRRMFSYSVTDASSDNTELINEASIKSNNISDSNTPEIEINRIFPTVLELIDCDTPWLKRQLVENLGIDKILVVPRFESITNIIERVDQSFTVTGNTVYLLQA